jgi:hypothetical protein
MMIEPLILRRADFGWNENDYEGLEGGDVTPAEIKTSFNLNSM